MFVFRPSSIIQSGNITTALNMYSIDKSIFNFVVVHIPCHCSLILIKFDTLFVNLLHMWFVNDPSKSIYPVV